MKGNSVRAGIVRKDNKEEEGLKPGLKDHRWFQGRVGKAILVSFPWPWCQVGNNMREAGNHLI